jgi:hypothetical protein
LTQEDVIEIRKRYAKHHTKTTVYKKYQNRITKSGFSKIWSGRTWPNVMPEVYTDENKAWHKAHPGTTSKTETRTERLYVVMMKDAEPVVFNSKSRSSARYAAYKMYGAGTAFSYFLKSITGVHVVREGENITPTATGAQNEAESPKDTPPYAKHFGDEEVFKKFCKEKNLPFAYIGQHIIQNDFFDGERPGVICGANGSGMLDVVFDGNDFTENCHPLYGMTYLDESGAVVAQYD